MKKRIDLLLFEKGLTESREQAQRYIEAGHVFCNHQPVRKPSQKCEESDILSCDFEDPYVSRGAYKLLDVLNEIMPDMTNKVCIDIGASTGGFTDLLLQRNAEKVYAIDCGFGQLHPKIAHNPKVVSLEKCNARTLKKQMFTPQPNVLVMDVSFISVTLIFDAIKEILAPDSTMFILIKPQFEAGAKALNKKGVVTSETIQLQCVEQVIFKATQTYGFKHCLTRPSSIRGPEGNQEYMVVFKN